MYSIQKVLVALLLTIVAPTSVRAQSVPAPVDTSVAVKRDTLRQVPTRPVTPIPAPAAVRTDDDAAFAAATVVIDSAAGEIARDSVVPVALDTLVVPQTVMIDSVRLVTRLLVANGAPEQRARPAAAAIMKYARLRAIDPLLLVGIIGVENAELVPRSRSHVGATGVMQVMPFWKKYIRDCGTNLSDVHTNVCFGTRILRIAMDETTSLRAALLRYNGCVKSPGCHRYASAVFSRTGQAVILSRAMSEPTPPAVSLTSMRDANGG
jgi:soluble lytic murein transglycosylase-like protein